MKKALIIVALLGLAVGRAAATGPNGSIVGEYVEARTAEVFTGGCIMGSEGEPSGREAILAWKVSRGSYDGVALDGLSVVAIVAADTNLGMHELGGAAPTIVKTAIMVDARADTAQRSALLGLARGLSPDLVRDIVEVKPVAISFQHEGDRVKVNAGEARLDVVTRFEHDPNCGAAQWFSPLSRTAESAVALTKAQSYSGSALGTKWQQNEKRSAFVGKFAY